MKLKDLAAEFPREAIHWRAQTLTKAGDKALALAYLDARDVMDRLDEVCGPEKWQSRYVETAKGRVLCEIGIKIGDEWVWKSDGAGDTAVEGEKCGISDALKRAAVQWGIGRYLYRLDAVWAPCETYDRNGKLHWKAWKGSPWNCVRNARQVSRGDDKPKLTSGGTRDRLLDTISRTTVAPRLEEIYRDEKRSIADMDEPHRSEVMAAFKRRKAELLPPDPAGQAPQDGHQYQ